MKISENVLVGYAIGALIVIFLSSWMDEAYITMIKIILHVFFATLFAILIPKMRGEK